MIKEDDKMADIKLPKLPYGEGSMSVRKDGLIMYRKNIKLDGMSVSKCVYAKTVKEALQKMKEEERNTKYTLQDSQTKETLCDALYYWAEHTKKPTLKAQSYNRLYGTIKNQIENSELGHYRYQSITSDELQSLIENLNNKNYSKSTIKKTYDCLNDFYRHISIKYKIDNPMLLVRMPINANINAEEKQIIWFEKNDIDKFCEEANKKWNTGSPRYQGGNALAANIYMGLRGGELLALQWEDIDFDKNTVHVYKTLIEMRENNSTQKGKTQFVVQKSTKRDNVRYVPLNSKAKELLLKHKKISQYNSPSDYVISTRNRKTSTLKNINDTVKAICKNGELEVQNASSHSLRHTCASLYFRKNVQIEIIAKILGHSVEVCRKTYVHFVEEQLKNAASKIDINVVEL